MNCECGPQIMQPWLKAATIEPDNIRITPNDLKQSV